jgi:cytochrome c556
VRIGRCSSILIGMLLSACSRTAPPAAPAPPFLPKASIRELMDAEVDPAADAIWDSVVVTITAAGEDDKQPRTEAEWQAVRRSAITLIEATNLLMMDHRRIAPADAPPVPGEASTSILEERLDANRPAFVGFAQALRNVSLQALEAIDARDATRLLEAGGEIDGACEACHLVYWYPPDLTPAS